LLCYRVAEGEDSVVRSSLFDSEGQQRIELALFSPINKREPTGSFDDQTRFEIDEK